MGEASRGPAAELAMETYTGDNRWEWRMGAVVCAGGQALSFVYNRNSDEKIPQVFLLML